MDTELNHILKMNSHENQINSIRFAEGKEIATCNELSNCIATIAMILIADSPFLVKFAILFDSILKTV